MDSRTSRGFLNNNPGNMDRSEPPWQGEIRDPADVRLSEFQRGELTRGRFCVFVSPQLGIRGMARNLFAYTDRLGLCAIDDLITQWAPPPKKGLVASAAGGEANGEDQNDTKGYIKAVADRLGVRPDTCVNLRDYKTLHAIVDAIIRHECGGMPYAGTEIEDGLLLAGVVKPVGVTTSKTATGLTIASGATVGGASVSALQEAVKQPVQIPAPPPPSSLPAPDFGGAIAPVQDTLRQAADTLIPFAGTSQTLDHILFALKIGMAVIALVGIGLAIRERIKRMRRDQDLALAAQENGL